jgi:hypothetical protein
MCFHGEPLTVERMLARMMEVELDEVVAGLAIVAALPGAVLTSMVWPLFSTTPGPACHSIATSPSALGIGCTRSIGDCSTPIPQAWKLGESSPQCPASS